MLSLKIAFTSWEQKRALLFEDRACKLKVSGVRSKGLVNSHGTNTLQNPDAAYEIVNQPPSFSKCILLGRAGQAQ